MAKTYTGKVSGRYGTTNPPPDIEPTVVVKIHGDTLPAVGSEVELRVLLTDEQLGQRLREMLTQGITKRSVREFATEVDNVGWPMLGDLIREVNDA
jgi:hypothetical protein